MSVKRLTVEEYRRIDAAIAEVERKTAADLDIVVTRASDRYSLYPLVWAAYVSILIALATSFILPGLNSRVVIFLQLLLVVALSVVLDWLPIRLMLVSTKTKQAHARQLARREFTAHPVVQGKDRNRILLFVSLGERYVEIIADHATHAMVPEGVWKKIVADFLAAVKDGRVADGIVAAIESCGELLETHHPGAPQIEA
jgi:putative membrane protein